MAFVDLKETMLPVLTSIYGEKDTRPILEELKKIIKLEEAKEKTMTPTKIEVGEIYITTCDFKNIGATVRKDRLIVIEGLKGEFEVSVAVYITQKDIDDKAPNQRWTLEKKAIKAYCFPYKIACDHTEPVKEEHATVIRMSQEQFRVALSEH